MKLFDTHCHIGLDGDDPAPPYERAVAAAVTDLVLVGIDGDSSRTARDRARQLPGVRWSAGLHPNSADAFDEQWEELQRLAGERRGRWRVPVVDFEHVEKSLHLK